LGTLVSCAFTVFVMAFELTLDEMIEAMRRSGMTDVAAQYTAALEAIGDTMARELAAKLHLNYGHPRYNMGMMTAEFYPIDGEPLPAAFKEFDAIGEWGERSALRRPA
jgi:hypothetical protein